MKVREKEYVSPSDALAALVKRGKKSGILLYSELEPIAQSMNLDENQTEQLMNQIEDQNIRIIGSEDSIFEFLMDTEPEEELPDFDTDFVPQDAFSAYAKEIHSIRLLTPEEELCLARRIADGDSDARNSFIRANLRLVLSEAYKVSRHCTMPLADLVQEGNIGLMRAVDKFDWTLGNKFSTYAIWWIRQAISRGIADQGHIIRIPCHAHEAANRISRRRRLLTQELGREPTDREVAMASRVTLEKLREITRITQDPLSLDTPMGSEDETSLGALVEDKHSLSPEEETAKAQLTAAVNRVLDTLTEREADVIRYRYGLHDSHEYTLDEVGKIFGVTRERIRQIEAKAFRKMKHPSRAQHLEDFLH